MFIYVFFQENSSHHRVVQLMGEAKLQGYATLLLRRHLPVFKGRCREVTVNRTENEGFGFVIISSSAEHRISTIGKHNMYTKLHFRKNI